MKSQLTVYKASAGSGKTFTLAREYMTLVIDNPHAYRTILAVTFTNKATEEMKLRILGQLYGIAHELPESDQYLVQIHAALPHLSEKQIRKNAEEALRLLIHNYNYFQSRNHRYLLPECIEKPGTRTRPHSQPPHRTQRLSGGATGCG